MTMNPFVTLVKKKRFSNRMDVQTDERTEGLISCRDPKPHLQASCSHMHSMCQKLLLLLLFLFLLSSSLLLFSLLLFLLFSSFVVVVAFVVVIVVVIFPFSDSDIRVKGF